jgi:hypothetical protein
MMPMGTLVSLPSQSSSRWLAHAAAIAAAGRADRKRVDAHATTKTIAIAPTLWV